MITMWIILGGAVAVTLIWRLHKASGRLDRIVREEVAEPERERLPASRDR